MITGLQEIGCLVVFIQNFDLEGGESWQGVAIVLFCLKVKEKIRKLAVALAKRLTNAMI